MPLCNRFDQLIGNRFVYFFGISVGCLIVPFVIVNLAAINTAIQRFSGGSHFYLKNKTPIIAGHSGLAGSKVNSSTSNTEASDSFEPDLDSGNNKIVMLWTQFFSQDWKDHLARNNGPYVYLDGHLPRQKSRTCFFTSNRTFLDKAEAVVFHGRDLNFGDLPPTRYPGQRYVYYLLESPLHAGYSGRSWLEVNRLGFNWSMTYALDADVAAPYGTIRKQQPLNENSTNIAQVERKIRHFTENFWKRKRDAVWLISNCVSHSRREVITKVLQEHGITVDSWGGCIARKPDIEFKKIGPEAFFSQYRFYLSFENSLCKDYVTEKAFQGFYYGFLAGPIPIVYGAANYSHYLPNGSYIDARSFESIGELAKFMRSLSCPSPSNQQRLAEFYQWHKTANPLYEVGYEIDPNTKLYVPDNAKRANWFNLCQRLWSDSASNVTSIVEHVEQRIGDCNSPDLRFIPEKEMADNDFSSMYRVTIS